MDENKYNDLDKLFRSRLRPEGTGSEDWNTPSDEVFDGAMARINKERKRRFPLIWLLPILLIVFLASLALWQRGEISEMESEISRLEQSVQVTPSTKSSTEEGTISQPNGPSSTQSSDLETTALSRKENVPSVNQSANSTIQHKQQASESNLKNKGSGSGYDNHGGDPGHSIGNISEQPSQQNISSAKQLNDVRPDHITQGLPYILPVLDEGDQFWAIDQPVNHVLADKKLDLSAFVIFSSELATLNMTDLPVVNYSLTEYDDYYFGYAVGLGGRLHIDQRWSLDLIGAYHHTFNKSEFINEMPYDKTREINAPGLPTTYDAQVDLVSPVSASQQSVTLNVDNMNIPDRDMIKNHTFIDQDFHMLSLSMAPRFHFLNSSRFNASIGIGGRLNYLLNTKEKMNVNIYHQDRTLKSETFEQADPPTINRYFGGVQGNLDISYMLSEEFSLGLQSGYYRSLTSIKQFNGADGAKTYLNSFNLSLTLSMHLK